MTETFRTVLFACLMVFQAGLAFAEEDSGGDEAASEKEASEPEPPAPSEDAEASSDSDEVKPAEVEVISTTVDEPAPVEPEPASTSAADLVQDALNNLATAQALVVAAEDELSEAERGQLLEELVAARRELEHALVAIGRMERGDDLRALLEEAGLVLTETERTAADEELERSKGLRPQRFEEVVRAITAVSFTEGKMQVLRSELADEILTSAQAWSFVELFSFSRDRVEALVFLHPKVVDQENFAALLGKLKFESDRVTVRERLGLDG